MKKIVFLIATVFVLGISGCSVNQAEQKETVDHSSVQNADIKKKPTVDNLVSDETKAKPVSTPKSEVLTSKPETPIKGCSKDVEPEKVT